MSAATQSNSPAATVKATHVYDTATIRATIRATHVDTHVCTHVCTANINAPRRHTGCRFPGGEPAGPVATKSADALTTTRRDRRPGLRPSVQ